MANLQITLETIARVVPFFISLIKKACLLLQEDTSDNETICTLKIIMIMRCVLV